MQLIIGQVSQEGISQLNQRFWESAWADFADGLQILALLYIDDDYDRAGLSRYFRGL